MTSRSFKPSSFSLRPQRPSYIRTSSNSSTNSIRSQNQDRPASSSSSAHSEAPETTPVQEPPTSGTASPRRSRPIAIELPVRRRQSTQINTPTPPAPLSGRGEILGGYFPFHEDVQSSYTPHPFHYEPTYENSSSQNNMPQQHSPLYTPQHSGSQSAVSSTPVMDHLSAMASPSVPLGKYHPSNYKTKAKPKELKVPAMSQAYHKRQSSDVRKKIQQYQRDIMEQAATAAGIPVPGQNSPEGPKLAPLGSPGPVTPFELEESAGYLVAGLGSKGATSDHQEIVGRFIEQERQRKAAGRQSPIRSPMRSPLRSPVATSPMR